MQDLEPMPKINVLLIALLFSLVFSIFLIVMDFMNWSHQELTIMMHLFLISVFTILAFAVAFNYIEGNPRRSSVQYNE